MLLPLVQVFYKAELFNTWHISNTTTHSFLSSLTKQKANIFYSTTVFDHHNTKQNSEKTNKKKSGSKNTSKSLFVVFPMAERTTIGLSSGKLNIRVATSFILLAEATEEPPNFMTHVKLVSPSLLTFSCSVTLFSITSLAEALHVTLNAILLPQTLLAQTGAPNVANPIWGLHLCMLLLTARLPWTPWNCNALAMLFPSKLFRQMNTNLKGSEKALRPKSFLKFSKARSAQKGKHPLLHFVTASWKTVNYKKSWLKIQFLLVFFRLMERQNLTRMEERNGNEKEKGKPWEKELRKVEMREENEGVLGLRERKTKQRKVWGNGGGTPLLFMSSHTPHERSKTCFIYVFHICDKKSMSHSRSAWFKVFSIY